MVKVAFPPEQLKALIPFGPVMGLATVAGPILAGWLLHLDLFGSQWRSIFLINVPIGLLAWAFAWAFLPVHGGEDTSARLDRRGVGLLCLASALLIIPLIEGRELGWPLWSLLSMAGSVVVLVLFVASERRSTHPVIAPTLFRKRSFVVGLVIVAAFFIALSGFQLAFNLLLQLGQHWTSLHTSLTLIPMAVGSAVAVVLAGAVLAQRLGRVTLQLGLGIAVVGLLALWWTLAHGDDPTSWSLAPSLALIGFGTGLVFVPIFEYVLGDATSKEVGTGSGMLNAIQQFAAAIGVAALGTVFIGRVNLGGSHSFDTATIVVIAIAAALYLVAFTLVWLLPQHAQHAEG